MTLGPLPGTVLAISSELHRLAGFAMTRLTAPVSAGDTVWPVESALDFPDAGIIIARGTQYTYLSKTTVTLEGIQHTDGVTVFNGAKIDIPVQSSVTDFSQAQSAMDRLRRAVLVDHAESFDLNTVGRNLGVPRLPAVPSDDVYRGIVKALAYNPRGTIYGIELALDAILGVGNYTIFEDLIAFPNTVFISLALPTSAVSAGKAFLEGADLEPATSNTTVDIDVAPINRGAVGSVAWKDENVVTETKVAKPSAQTIEEYPGDSGTQIWTFTGGTESTEVLVLTDDGGTTQIGIDGSSTGYEHLARIQPESDALFEVLMRIEAPSNLGLNTATFIAIHDTQKKLAVGFEDAGGGNFNVGLIDGTGYITGAAIALGDASGLILTYHSIAIRKRGIDKVELIVNGAVVQTEDYTAFASSTAHKFEFFITAGTPNPQWKIRQLALWAHTSTDYWSSRGINGLLAASNPTRIDVNIVGHFGSGDIGKRLRTFGSVLTNSQGGNNNGIWKVDTIVNDEIVTLIGEDKTSARVVATQRIIIENDNRAFTFPDDLGKKIIIENSTLGNDGTYIIDKLFQVGTLTDFESFDSIIEERTNICEVVSASFVAESDLEWHLEPDFINETNMPWEMSDAGSISGTTLTLRQALPITTGGYTRVLAVRFSRVLSSQILFESEILNAVIDEGPPVLYSYYPFYLFDPLAAVRGYLDAITAAGVIAEKSVE